VGLLAAVKAVSGPIPADVELELGSTAKVDRNWAARGANSKIACDDN
jgi:hypothetical protein